MKKVTLTAIMALALAACQNEPKFHIEGTITGAEGKMLYFEASDIEEVETIDSLKLKADGSFDFAGNRPASPEFYRLRVDEKVINLTVDSTETLKVKASYDKFATDYDVEGSPNSIKIKELVLKQAQLQKQVNELLKTSQAGGIQSQMFEDSLTALVNNYKTDVKIHYIFSAPNTSAAYFALFQKLDNYMIFDPLNSKEDVKCFAAVATSLNAAYPHADRTKNLYNIAIKGMKNTRTPGTKTIEIPQEKISEASIIDIALRDVKGNVRKLTELKGKVVLLDFTIYQSTVSVAHNLMLRELYTKYAAQGLEIYQVSLDADEHFWKTSADNLPWVCVRDGNGVYSSIASIYSVKNIPTFFLVNRNNELSKRDSEIKDLEVAIKALL